MTGFPRALLTLAAVPLLCGAVTPPRALSMSIYGIGRLDPGIPATPEAFRRIFNGYAVSSGTDTMEDEQVGQQLIVRWQGKTVLIAHTDGMTSKTISTIEVLSPEVAGPHGIRVGARFDAVQKLGAWKCERGQEQLSASVYCAVESQPLFAYRGDVSDLAAAGASLADDEIPKANVLRKLKVRAIIWKAREAAKANALSLPPSALSPAQQAVIEEKTSTLTAEEKANVARESDARKLAEFFCAPLAEVELRKKLPTADRVSLEQGDEKDESKVYVLTGNKLTGHGMARANDGWQTFSYECTLDPEKATATVFVFTLGELQRF